MDFNYSPVDEKFNIVLNDLLVKAIRIQARQILTPFFRKVAISSTENDNGQSYPVLTTLAERIISQVYQDGELSFSSREKAKVIALTFVKKLRDWERECLAFYFSTDNTKVEELELEGRDTFLNDTPEDSWDKEIGKVIKQSIRSMTSSHDQLTNRIVNELIHLQDIFSTEDENNWDASSIDYANENFKSYTGSDIKLIPFPIEDFEYWNKIIEQVADEVEDEEVVEDELKEEIFAESKKN